MASSGFLRIVVLAVTIAVILARRRVSRRRMMEEDALSTASSEYRHQMPPQPSEYHHQLPSQPLEYHHQPDLDTASTGHHHERVQIKVYRGPDDDHHWAPHGYWVKQPSDDDHH